CEREGGRVPGGVRGGDVQSDSQILRRRLIGDARTGAIEPFMRLLRVVDDLYFGGTTDEGEDRPPTRPGREIERAATQDRPDVPGDAVAIREPSREPFEEGGVARCRTRAHAGYRKSVAVRAD